jgi:hypothetical protein
MGTQIRRLEILLPWDWSLGLSVAVKLHLTRMTITSSYLLIMLFLISDCWSNTRFNQETQTVSQVDGPFGLQYLYRYDLSE